jgi:hypothetical protein
MATTNTATTTATPTDADTIDVIRDNTTVDRSPQLHSRITKFPTYVSYDQHTIDVRMLIMGNDLDGI